METEINNTITVLKKGGLILYPTDTIWGIGCDATNENAVKKVFEIKKRNKNKPLISLVGNKKQLMTFTKLIPKEAENKTPTTIIYKNIFGLASNLTGNEKSAAIRIVQDEFCKQLILKFGKPIVSTSANISTQELPNQFSKISTEIKKNIDYIVNLRLKEIMTTPSRILLLNDDGSVKKIRP